MINLNYVIAYSEEDNLSCNLYPSSSKERDNNKYIMKVSTYSISNKLEKNDTIGIIELKKELSNSNTSKEKISHLYGNIYIRKLISVMREGVRLDWVLRDGGGEELLLECKNLDGESEYEIVGRLKKISSRCCGRSAEDIQKSIIAKQKLEELFK